MFAFYSSTNKKKSILFNNRIKRKRGSRKVYQLDKKQ